MSVINTINARIVELESQMNSIMNSVEKDERLLTAEESETLEKAQSEFAELSKQSKLLNGISAQKSAIAEPHRLTRSVITGGEVNGAKKNLGGFRNAAEYFSAVKAASMGRHDARLLNVDPSNETTAGDGGYAVPTDARRNIWSYVIDQGSLLPMTDQYQSVSNVLTFPKDTVQGDGSTYVAAWTAESGTIAEKKISLGQQSVTAHKLSVAINATEELLEDSVALEQFINKKAGEAFQFAINKAILSGTGVGQPTGLLVGNQYSQVAASVSGTVTAADVHKMYFRMPQQDRAGAVWLVSPAVEAILPGLVLSGTTVPAYLPPGGLSASPFATLLGRPVIVHPNASALGAVGDISFVNLKKYMTLVKSPEIKSDVSMHVYFLNDVQTFKFTMRLGGKPWLDAVPTLGGVSYSPFVGLAVR